MPPKVEKNFLISPPGSPPVGWEPIREEPPNNAPLAEDLIIALRRLQFSHVEGSSSVGPSVSVLIEPEEGPGVGVYVEDCGDEDWSKTVDDDDPMDQGEGWFYGSPLSQERFVPMPTMRPPMPTSV